MKLNKLLPIVALSGIATVAMPLVSCGGKKTVDDTWGNDDFVCTTDEGVLYKSNKTVNLVKGQTYSASIELSCEELAESDVIQIMAGKNFGTDDFELYDFKNASDSNATLTIGNDNIDLPYYEGVYTPAFSDSYINSTLHFTFNCLSDFENVVLMFWFL